MAINKDEIKLRLDNLPELKENMVYQNDWRDFKASMSSLIVEYSKNPTPENKQKINRLIENNFLDKSFVASQAIDNLIIELGINKRSSNNRKKSS